MIKLSNNSIQTLSFKGEHATIGGIGIIHGLASNDELLLLLTLTLGLNNFGTIFIGLLIFSFGVVLGMIFYGTLLRLPFSKFGQERVVRIINLTIATLTLGYGLYIIFGGGTVNLLPFITEEFGGALYIIALALGIKHSMDADHVVAISGILLRAPSVKRTVTLSISWAFGHMLTASIITFILYSFKQLFLKRILMNFNYVVAFMLIAIALLTFAWEFNIITWGKHTHSHVDGTVHTHGDGATHSHIHNENNKPNEKPETNKMTE